MHFRLPSVFRQLVIRDVDSSLVPGLEGGLVVCQMSIPDGQIRKCLVETPKRCSRLHEDVNSTGMALPSSLAKPFVNPTCSLELVTYIIQRGVAQSIPKVYESARPK